MADDKAPFWRTKSLSDMTKSEWESLCDGCGRCCLNKLTDIDTNETVFTDVGCRLLDDKTCRCRDYAHRQRRVPDCVRLTPRNVKRLTWLPPTCGYRLVAEGKDLAWWHPLGVGECGDGAHRRYPGARARGREREGRAGREAGGIYRRVAGEVAEGGAAQARRQRKMRAREERYPRRSDLELDFNHSAR